MIRRAAIVMSLITSFFTLFSMPLYAAEFSPLNIYLVRHGQTVGNATGNHSAENDRTFSKKGLQQVAELTKRLTPMRFDHILVSPKERAMKTILPYLKAPHLKAEIWPELAECCWQKRVDARTSFNVNRGQAITLDSSMAPYFIFADKASKQEYLPSGYSDGMLMIFKSSDKIVRNYHGSGKNILVVGHYHAGGRLIELLQGLEPEGRYQLSNAKMAHLRENSNGTFRLISINH